MNNDEKILKALEVLQADVKGLKTDITDIKQDMLTKQELASTKQEIMAAIEKEAEGMAVLFHETWDKMGMTNERITRLEEAADLTHRN